MQLCLRVVTVIYVMCLSFLHFPFFVILRCVNRLPRKRTQEINNPVLCVWLWKKKWNAQKLRALQTFPTSVCFCCEKEDFRWGRGYKHIKTWCHLIRSTYLTRNCKNVPANLNNTFSEGICAMSQIVFPIPASKLYILKNWSHVVGNRNIFASSYETE